MHKRCNAILRSIFLRVPPITFAATLSLVGCDPTATDVDASSLDVGPLADGGRVGDTGRVTDGGGDDVAVPDAPASDGGGIDGGGSDGGTDAGTSTAFRYVADFLLHMGGTRQDNLRDLVFTPDGGLVVVGGTFLNGSTHDIVPSGVTPNVIRSTCPAGVSGSGANMDIFVARLDPAGALVWMTLIGGPYYERAYGVEIAPDGDIVLAGRAGACAPTTAGTVQPAFGGDAAPNVYGPQDGYVVRLTSGGAMRWSTYIGGNDGAFIRDVAVDSHGDVLVGTFVGAGTVLPAGWASSAFATAFQTSTPGNNDSLIVKIASNGASVRWASRLGGSQDDGTQPSIRVDPNDDSVILLTHGQSTNVNTNAPAASRFGSYPSGGAGNHGLLMKLTSAGAHVFTRHLGASGPVNGDTHNLAVHTDGTIVTGDSLCRDSGCFSTAGDAPGALSSLDPATTAGAVQPNYGGGGYPPGNLILGNYPGDGYIVRFSSDGSTVLASTFFGGSRGEGIEGVAVTASGTVVISGGTNSTTMPGGAATEGAYQGGLDGFVAVLSSDLTRVLYMRYLGSDQDNNAGCVATLGNRVAVGGVTGRTGTLHVSFMPQTNPFAHLTSGAVGGTVVLPDLGHPGDEDGWLFTFDQL